MKLNQKHVVKEFSSKGAQEKYIAYAEEGLWKSEKELIDKYFKKGGSTLDLGCGTGRTTIVLKDLGYKIIGIDITPKMIENAKKIAKKKKLKIDYRVGDATNLKFKDNSFDYALFSNQGWTQIPGKDNRIKVLNEVKRILKPKGIYIFTFHPRRFFSKFFFKWRWNWIKHYILRPLGFKTEELEYGDVFFEKEGNMEGKYDTKQFIHIPSESEVRKQVGRAGFKILFTGEGLSEMSGFKPIFVVCRKRGSK